MTMRSTARGFVGGAVALTLTVAAALQAAGGPAEAASSKAPTVKVILLAETQGESSAAVPYYADGMGMAAEELGDKVDYSRIPAPLTPDAAQTALLQAIDQKPNVLVGFPASSQIVALSSQIEQSGIPFFGLSSGEQLVASGPNGAPNIFLIRPVDTLIAKAEADYAIKDLKAKKIGLECVANATGVNGCNAAKKVIAQNPKVSIVAERQNGIADTDLTEQARAMQGADVVLDYNFPNPLAVMSKQLVDNGVNVPHVDGASAGIIANSGAVTGDAATNLRGVDDCVPTADKRSKVQKWVAAYKSKYGVDPIYSAAQSYDILYFITKLVQQTGSVAPAKLIKAIPSVTYDGICTTYKSDALHVLSHAADIVKFDAAGAESIAKHLTFAPGELPFTVVTTTTAPPTTTTTAPPA
jgi:branched-chain amino acid transport system substrate-binding protein